MNNDPHRDPNLNRLAGENTANIPSPKGINKEQGESGTIILSGIITGEEYNRSLVGRSAIRIYDIMRRSDSTVHSALLVCKLPILSAIWDIEPASDDEPDQYAARFIKRELFERNIVFSNHIREALTMLDFGHSLAEKVLEPTDFEGQYRIGISKLGFRKQTSIYKWETLDEQPGVTQQLIGKEVSIPLDKLVVYTNDKEGDNYEGISVLRYAYKDWDMKDKLGLVNAIALEKMSIGIPVLKKPDNADVGELARARLALKEMRANESAYQEIPTGWELEMLDMKANSVKDVIPTIKYHDRQIVRTVLAQFLELGGTSGSSGSRALSQDHSALFVKSLEAVAKVIRDTIQEQIIKQLCDFNFSDLPNGYPKLTVGKIGDDDTTGLADSVQKLVTSGAITPNFDTEQRLRESFHLPELPEDQKAAIDKKGLETPLPQPPNPGGGGDLSLPPDPNNKTKAAIKTARIARQNLLDSLR